MVRAVHATRTHELDGQAVILDVSRNVLHLLNPSATSLWKRLDGQTTVERHAVEMAVEFEAPIDVVLSDLINALRQLGSEGLIALASESPQ